MMKNCLLILLLPLILSKPANTQRLDSLISMSMRKYPGENIYIHYDRNFYSAGDTVWFKAYLYSQGAPSGQSNHFYMQLTDMSGRVITKLHFPVKGATVGGDLLLPDSLQQGHYIIEAITPGMMNGLEQNIYAHDIFVLNPRKAGIEKNAMPVNAEISVQFFPESGEMVDQVMTTVAFKAADSSGRPLSISGQIKTADGVYIMPFVSQHDGMGSFRFRPQVAKKYIAQVSLNGKNVLFPLPEVKESGISLHIENEPRGKGFVITRSLKNKAAYEKLWLIARINNAIVYEEEISFDLYESVKGHLLTDSLPAGILHFTVFNQDLVPLAERLSFLNNRSFHEGEIKLLKTGLGKREENLVEISFPDTLQRSCSVAITETGSSTAGTLDNIVTRFLMTDELKGNINNPAWYFNPANDSGGLALDHVMLTHGWSRFNWSKILANSPPPKQYTDSYLINISGQLTDEKTKSPAAAGSLSVFITAEDSSMFSYEIPVSDKGTFLLDSLLIMGKTRIYYTYKDQRGKERLVNIKTDDEIKFQGVGEILTSGYPAVTETKTVSLKDTALAVKRFEMIQKGNAEAKVLENVILKSTKKRVEDIVNEKYTSQIFRSGGRVIVNNENGNPTEGFMNAFDYIKNRISTVDTQYGTFVNRKNFSLSNYNLVDAQKGIMRYWEVGLYINENQANIYQLKILRADQIAYVKFFESGFFGAGSEFPGGAIAVYLKDGTTSQRQKPPARYIEYNGYSISREFFNPDYSLSASTPGVTDKRITLYWNPELYTNEKEKTLNLKFNNSDIVEKYTIVLEGFDIYGRLIHLEKTVQPAEN
ncbi:MAG: hypothetical protein IPP93_15040 [Chitinophagaceae bacterium]|nr:hypothetical protein [Chitinophagaceae bacterium]